jgi:type IV pilus assembly protein PilM
VFLTRKKQPLIGLDISSTSVKVMELSKTGTRYQIEGISIEPLLDNAVVEKKIVEIEAVGESIKRALHKAKIKNRNVAIAVAGSSVITKIITMPISLSEEEMEGQIQLEADQYIPYPLEEVALDFQVMGKTKQNSETVDVLLAACRQENVDDRMAAAELAGLVPKVVDIEAYTIESIFSSLAFQLPDGYTNKTIAIADIGATMTSLSVIQNHKLIYTREQNFGGKQLTEEIMQHYGLSPDEAELAKRQGGLPENYTTELLNPFKETTIQQISRLLQFFYSSGEGNDTIDYLILGGGNACLPNLVELAELQIGVPTSIAKPFINMSASKKINTATFESDSPSFLIAAGLAIRGTKYQ